MIDHDTNIADLELPGDKWDYCNAHCKNRCDDCPTDLQSICMYIGRRAEEEQNQAEGEAEGRAMDQDYQRSR